MNAYMIDIYDLLGFIGVALSLYGYARVQLHRDYAKNIAYSLFNLSGATLLMISLCNKWNMASFIGNAIWAFISIYGVSRCVKYMLRSNSPTSSP